MIISDIQRIIRMIELYVVICYNLLVNSSDIHIPHFGLQSSKWLQWHHCKTYWDTLLLYFSLYGLIPFIPYTYIPLYGTDKSNRYIDDKDRYEPCYSVRTSINFFGEFANVCWLAGHSPGSPIIITGIRGDLLARKGVQ